MNNKVTLNYYQVISLLYKIDELRNKKEKTEELEKEEVIDFYSKAIAKYITIFMATPIFLQNYIKRKYQYIIPTETYNILVQLTSINPLEGAYDLEKINIIEFEKYLYAGYTPVELRKKAKNVEKEIDKKYTSNYSNRKR